MINARRLLPWRALGYRHVSIFACDTPNSFFAVLRCGWENICDDEIQKTIAFSLVTELHLQNVEVLIMHLGPFMIFYRCGWMTSAILSNRKSQT